MNPTAIYSKSGKGVQEAAGKTSLLSRPDRAVLSAIDGRATLQDVAAKVGKAWDQTFLQLITKLDKDGFIREVSAGTVGAAAPAAKPAAKAPPKPAPKAAAPADPASDLDFSMLGGPSKPAQSTPPVAKASPPPARPAAPPPPPPPPPPKEQESALFKARQEAEAKAQAEKDRQRKEAEDKVRAETESKLRAEAEAKARADAEARLAAENEAKLKAAREAAIRAAAEAKAKADAEAKRAREEAERVKREAEERERRAREEAERVRREAEERERKAREEAERVRREAEEKARREQEELRRRLEEERKAREEAERRAREEAERVRREAEAEAERVRRAAEEEAERVRRQLEDERRALEEARRRREEEEAREAVEREARRRAREEEEAREAEESAARKAAQRKPEPAREEAPAPAAAAPKAAAGGGFADSLMADLDSFNTHEEAEAKAKEEAERKAREEAARRAREEAERRAKEDAEREEREAKQRAKEEKARQKREEEERLRREEEEEKERIRIEEEKREREAEERKRKAKEEEALARQASSSSAGGYVAEDKRRKRQLEVGRRDPSLVHRKQSSWGKRAALALFVILLAALGAAHVMPISTVEYERAASEALGRPVRLGDARLWLFTGLELRIDGASAGDVKIARVIARPSIFSLTEPKKVFSSIELHGVSLPQQALGQVLFARLGSDLFEVKQVMARQLELPGQVPLPKNLDAELVFRADGSVLSGVVRGPDGLVARLEPKDDAVGFQVDAGSFSIPFAPEVTLTTFGMKGVASAQGAQVKEWGGALLGGNISGTARVRWGGTWVVEGVMTARGINAAVFAPALLSEGTAEGTGKFSLVGPEPAKLGANGRMEGNFSVGKGVLGSFDLSRAIQTSGKQAQGRTQFAEMNGQAIYDRGEVELRNVTIGAGALNAGATAAIDEKGALSGRIVADVRTASQTLRATLLLGGTVKEPQVRN